MRSIALKILLEELEENHHPENVEDVIFWALEAYSKQESDTWGKKIAYTIKERILEEEKEAKSSENLLIE